MKVLRMIRNYVCYCGIEKDEYNAVKKDAYISNYNVWRILHFMMLAVFALLSVSSLKVDIMTANRVFYLISFAYSAVAAVLFGFVLKKDSLAAQLLIYLSISVLFLFGVSISQNKPDFPATTFIVLLLITPMFVIDKPYFMAIELTAAAVIYLSWMRGIKDPVVWRMDAGNVIIFTVVGIFLHIIANSIRIKEFVLTREINIQKDIDELTGLKNKSCVTREINEYLADARKDKGIMLLLDLDRFKAINDTYGHDTGDAVITQFGGFLLNAFRDGEIVGRFGGDEFIVFIKDTCERADAEDAARKIVDGAAALDILADKGQSISASIGIAMYSGKEKNYSEIFKKADMAMYSAKADTAVRYSFYRS